MDSFVEVLDVATGKVTRRLQGSTNRVTAVTFSPNGDVLASATGYATDFSSDRTISFWEVSTGNEIRRLKDTSGAHDAMSFSPDGRILASLTEGRVLLWDLATFKIAHTLTAKSEQLWCFAFAPDGHVIATGDADSIVRLWDTRTGREFRCFKGHGRQRYADGVLAVAFSPDGRFILSSGGDETTRLWDVKTGKELRKFDQDISFTDFLVFSPTGKLVASGLRTGNRIRLWEVATGQQARLFGGHQDFLTSITLSADAHLVVTSGYDGTIRVWDVKTGTEVRRFNCARWDADVTTLSPDGRILAFEGLSKPIRLRTFPEGKELLVEWTQDMRGFPIFSPDGTLLASMQACPRFVDVRTGRQLYQLTNGLALGLAFAADGRSVAVAAATDRREETGHYEYWIHVHDVRTGKLQRQLFLGHQRVTSLAVSPDGQVVAMVVVDMPIRLWWLSKGQRCTSLGIVQKQEQVLAFAPDGRVLAAARADGAIDLWELATSKVRRRFDGHKGTITGLAFAQDGTVLASGSRDSTAIIWDLTSPISPNGLRPWRADKAALEECWRSLEGEAAAADDAMRRLIQSPTPAVPFIAQRLCPVPLITERRVKTLIGKLESDRLTERQKAISELSALRDVAEPALMQVLNGRPSLEVRRRVQHIVYQWETASISPELLRAFRVVEVLERINSDKSRHLLREISSGAGTAHLTHAARQALTRLAASHPRQTSIGEAAP
jgi:WD40 repeat protein